MADTTSSAEQRLRAVQEMLAGEPVAEVSRRYEVSRQSLYRWRSRYEKEGLAGLQARSRRPHSSPGRLRGSVESLICALRAEQPGWGSRRLVTELARRGIVPLPSHSTVHRVLVRNELIAKVRDGAASHWAEAGDERDRRIARLEEEVRRLTARLDSAAPRDPAPCH
ncbi:helix-turn-helix domain-containing protein [Streptacidiphilus jiangxiensis]|uniref:Helix-turn-helix domain-containing protein n=1 Tax=Streptacidiphilus jiangxiensis TaxID=235985 RepID=A0A1H7L1R4_STRJI|nr:helix-turn-helix domain-containing protein [Streptacidiphilus jiangxiensis]SEK92720.1 Helix-turn-helix domain-containing protein [Streptacidiphilus jiangxiensis]